MQGQAAAVNDVPGFLCPACERVHIKLSLQTFLGSQDVPCPSCGTSFSMDKSQCSRLVELLQELQVANQNVAALKSQSL
jgi:hypothetical protein